MADELARTRLLVLATFRDTTGGPLADLLPALLRTDSTRPVRLTGLSRSGIAQWLRRLQTAGDVDKLADRLRAGTGGNPPFVRMLTERGVSAAGDGLSGFPELRHLVLAQLGRLGGPARDLLDAASVLGERIDPPVLTEVTGLTAAQAGTLLDQAVAQGVLASAADIAGLWFGHAVVRDAVYHELAPSRRMALHERAARALERSGRGAAVAGQIASHWQRSGGPDWAAHCVRWAREAARSATASLAYDEAARFAALPCARLRARQVIVAAETGAGHRARELSAEALALAGHSGDQARLLHTHRNRHLAAEPRHPIANPADHSIALLLQDRPPG